MKFIIVHADGRYFCSPRMLVKNFKFARVFGTFALAKRFVEQGTFRPEDCKIVRIEK